MISHALKINCNTSQGSGYRISKDIIATAKHVVEDCTWAEITDNEGRTSRSNRITLSSSYDIAYLYMPNTIGRIIKKTLDLPIQGDVLYAVGSPIDGLVLSKGRMVRSFKNLSGEWLEIDIAADHGNSGGPVFSESGFVGMVISKNTENARINAYSASLIFKDLEKYIDEAGQASTPSPALVEIDSRLPLFTQLFSASIAFVFGIIVGIAIIQGRNRRLKKKRIRIIIEN